MRYAQTAASVALGCSVAALAIFIPQTTHAQARAVEPPLDVRQIGQRWLESATASQPPGAAGPTRIEVIVGELDPRLQLAPCTRIEPYMPTGTSLWGNSRLGLRCVEGAVRWNVFLPVTIKAWGPAWVLRYAVPAGAVLKESDAVQTDVDWAAQPAPVVPDVAQWAGQTAAYSLAGGQALRQSMLRPPQAFAAGAPVRVVMEGPGFSVEADGLSASQGYVGQTVKVRMETGKVLGGTVVDSRTVRISY